MKNALKSLSFDLPVMLQSKLLAVKSQKGVTMIEYALLGSLIALIAIGGLTGLGPAIQAAFIAITAKIVVPA
ncbi:Flp family type IVb pilin [Pelodictyon luteolum]|uniref:Flp family type IVb pilin n=1 Tax=Pelodictyon luteolum TaxID=1100 RepID=UPI00059E4B41|nr:Flp family type IVb pilin [Pelodictyon luteolum]